MIDNWFIFIVKHIETESIFHNKYVLYMYSQIWGGPTGNCIMYYWRDILNLLVIWNLSHTQLPPLYAYTHIHGINYL